MLQNKCSFKTIIALIFMLVFLVNVISREANHMTKYHRFSFIGV